MFHNEHNNDHGDIVHNFFKKSIQKSKNAALFFERPLSAIKNNNLTLISHI